MEPSTREQRIIERQTGYDPVIAPWVWMLEDSRRRTKEAMQGISGWRFTSYGWIWRTQMLKALRPMTPAEFRRGALGEIMPLRRNGRCIISCSRKPNTAGRS